MLRKTHLLLLFAIAGIPATACSTGDGQRLIDDGRYRQAIRAFTCVIEANPAGVDGYRGRIEAALLLGEISNAARDHARITARVLPFDPAARQKIIAGYEARLKADPDSVAALTGLSFARWWFFDYAQAIQSLNRLIALTPNGVYANLLRGSARMLSKATAAGAADLEKAIALAPSSPDVRFIVADAYTYGQPNPQRAFAEASLALQWGLDTPRVRAILASSYLAFGNMTAAAEQFAIHIQQVTTEFLQTQPLAPGGSLTLAVTPGRTFEVPVSLAAGQALTVATSSKDYFDTILVLLAPDGMPIAANDDAFQYFAGLDFVAPAAGTYKVQVTFFEGVSTGALTVARK